MASATKNYSSRSKHRNQSERKRELLSRREIQNAVPNLAATAAITTANSLTPFLTLPQELKNRIYELVLGKRLLHVKRYLIKSERDVVRSTKGTIKERRFTNQICSSRISEEDALDCFKSQDGSSLFVDGVELRHSNCHPSSAKNSTYIPDRMNINLLHTCRQIYDEARFMPYSTNTFSFDTPRNLRAFVHYLTRQGVNVNRAIRSLHIDLAYDGSDLHTWTQAFKAVVQHMALLEKIYINLDQRSTWSTINVEGGMHAFMRQLLDCFAILGRTSTRCIEIIVSDRRLSTDFARWNPAAQAPWTASLWTVEEKREWVEKVKLAIKDRQLLV